jgi:hypothetical protein
MERGGQGHPTVSPGPAIPDPSTPCGQATPKMALQLSQGWLAHGPGGLQPSSTLLDTPCCTPMAEEGWWSGEIGCKEEGGGDRMPGRKGKVEGKIGKKK